MPSYTEQRHPPARQEAPFTQGRCVIAPAIGGESFIQISVRARSRVAEKQGKGQAR